MRNDFSPDDFRFSGKAHIAADVLGESSSIRSFSLRIAAYPVVLYNPLGILRRCAPMQRGR